MKNVRIFYSKLGRMKYISHLDMTRYMARLVKISGIPAWHTEGFNKHLYLTFALPLSLGMSCDYDSIDLKITDDGFSCDKIMSALNNNAAEGIKVMSVCEPEMKTSDIAFAEYEMVFKDSDSGLLDNLEEYVQSGEIIAEKKGKKGNITRVNVAEKIKEYGIKREDGVLEVRVKLPAGNTENINPTLILNAFTESGGRRPEVVSVSRKMLYNAENEQFC